MWTTDKTAFCHPERSGGKKLSFGLRLRQKLSFEEPRSRGISRRGFTLIELLIAIAIIGILSTIATVSLSQARERARDAKRVADIQQIRNALLLYSNARATYPDGTDIKLGTGNAVCLDDTDAGFKAVCTGQVIMGRIPPGPQPPEFHTYSKTGPQDYTITFRLEGEIGSLNDTDDNNMCTATKDVITC